MKMTGEEKLKRQLKGNKKDQSILGLSAKEIYVVHDLYGEVQIAEKDCSSKGC